MKPEIHPQYGPCTVTCACGEVFHSRSTVPQIQVEICSKCHPLFTGRQKLIDTEGRVERFQRKYGVKKATSPAESGSLSAAVEHVYPLEQFKEAFEQSLKSNRSGKILFKFGARGRSS